MKRGMQSKGVCTNCASTTNFAAIAPFSAQRGLLMSEFFQHRHCLVYPTDVRIIHCALDALIPCQKP